MAISLRKFTWVSCYEDRKCVQKLECIHVENENKWMTIQLVTIQA